MRSLDSPASWSWRWRRTSDGSVTSVVPGLISRTATLELDSVTRAARRLISVVVSSSAGIGSSMDVKNPARDSVGLCSRPGSTVMERPRRIGNMSMPDRRLTTTAPRSSSVTWSPARRAVWPSTRAIELTITPSPSSGVPLDRNNRRPSGGREDAHALPALNLDRETDRGRTSCGGLQHGGRKVSSQLKRIRRLPGGHGRRGEPGTFTASAGRGKDQGFSAGEPDPLRDELDGHRRTILSGLDPSVIHPQGNLGGDIDSGSTYARVQNESVALDADRRRAAEFGEGQLVAGFGIAMAYQAGPEPVSQRQLILQCCRHARLGQIGRGEHVLLAKLRLVVGQPVRSDVADSLADVDVQIDLIGGLGVGAELADGPQDRFDAATLLPGVPPPGANARFLTIDDVVVRVVRDAGHPVGQQVGPGGEHAIFERCAIFDEAQVVLVQEIAAEEFRGAQALELERNGHVRPILVEQPVKERVRICCAHRSRDQDVAAVLVSPGDHPPKRLTAQVVVRVSEEDVPARALGDRTIAWLTRPSRVRLMDHPQPAVARGVAVQDFAAAVRRPVVDADHVECDTGDVLGGEGVEKHGKEAGLVEDRDDNRDVTPLVHAGIVTPSASLPWDLNSEPSRCSTRPCQCAPDARGRSWRLITSRVGERRTTSRKPALSYRLRDPKNMKSSWLRSGLSTGYASSMRTPCSRAKSMAPASSLCWWPWPRWLLAT